MFRIHRNRSTTKSQTSAEFIIVLIVLLLIFIFLFSIYFDSASEVSYRREQAGAKRIVDTLALTINDVYVSGTPQTITLPSKILGRETYDLQILPAEHLVSIEWANGYYSYPILTSTISYSTLGGGTFHLAYVEGEVVIS